MRSPQSYSNKRENKFRIETHGSNTQGIEERRSEQACYQPKHGSTKNLFRNELFFLLRRAIFLVLSKMVRWPGSRPASGTYLEQRRDIQQGSITSKTDDKINLQQLFITVIVIWGPKSNTENASCYIYFITWTQVVVNIGAKRYDLQQNGWSFKVIE